MKERILLLPIMCVLITSCNSTPDAKSTPDISQKKSSSIISSGVIECATQNQMAPMKQIYPLIYGYKLANNRFPQSPQELIDFNNTTTNEPCINLDDFKVLTFTVKDDDSLTVIWETHNEPTSKGSFTVDPSGDAAQSSEFTCSGTVDTAQPPLSPFR